MNAYQAYVQHPENWINLPDRHSTPKPFYTIQKGRGATLQTISPMEGVIQSAKIQNAKIKLRKQIKRSNTKRKPQSRIRKGRAKVTKTKATRKGNRKTPQRKVKRKSTRKVTPKRKNKPRK